MGDYAKAGAEIADGKRGVIAYLRAVRDERHDDAWMILKGIQSYRVMAYLLALITLAEGQITDEWLDRMLGMVNEDEVTGELERFAEHFGIKAEEHVSTAGDPELIGMLGNATGVYVDNRDIVIADDRYSLHVRADQVTGLTGLLIQAANRIARGR